MFQEIVVLKAMYLLWLPTKYNFAQIMYAVHFRMGVQVTWVSTDTSGETQPVRVVAGATIDSMELYLDGADSSFQFGSVCAEVDAGLCYGIADTLIEFAATFVTDSMSIERMEESVICNSEPVKLAVQIPAPDAKTNSPLEVLATSETVFWF
jgi:hypothetical protein